MAVLKDVQCRSCGHVAEAMVDGEKTSLILDCPGCSRSRLHTTLCRGGTKVITWGVEGVDVNDFIRLEGVKAGVPRPEDIGTANESRNATSVKDRHGREIDKRATFTADGLAERREKRDYARKRRRYGAKVQIG